jgi:hypothetical protein
MDGKFTASRRSILGAMHGGGHDLPVDRATASR